MSKLDEMGGLKVAHKIFDEDCHLDGPTIEERFGRALVERVEELERREANASLIPPESRIAKLEGQLQAARKLAEKVVQSCNYANADPGSMDWCIPFGAEIEDKAREFLEMLEE